MSDENTHAPEPNHSPTPRRPPCNLLGTDGSIDLVVARVARVLRQAGELDAAETFTERARRATSIADALALAAEYVEVQ